MLSLPALVMLVLPTIWIVDAANGPGTNFLDLPPAVAAAASGDTIIVRAGSYTRLQRQRKGADHQGSRFVDDGCAHLHAAGVDLSGYDGRRRSSRIGVLHERVDAHGRHHACGSAARGDVGS